MSEIWSNSYTMVFNYHGTEEAREGKDVAYLVKYIYVHQGESVTFHDMYHGVGQAQEEKGVYCMTFHEIYLGCVHHGTKISRD